MEMVLVEGTEEVVNPARNCFLFFLLVLTPFFCFAQQNLIIFSELSSGIQSEQKTDEINYTNLFLELDNNLISNSVELNLNTSMARSLTDNDLYSWSAELSTAADFPGFNLVMFALFTENIPDSLTRFQSSLNLFTIRDYHDKYRKSSLLISWNQVREIDKFTNLDINPNFSLKYYYKKSALHHDFGFKTRFFTELTDPTTLLAVQYQVLLSFTLMKKIGTALGYNLNYNLISSDNLIYEDYQLYDEFAFNQHRFFGKFTFFRADIKFQPRFELAWNQYQKTVSEENLEEISYLSGLYIDYFFYRNFLFYCDAYYQVIDDQTEYSAVFEISGGIRFQFDLYTPRDE